MAFVLTDQSAYEFCAHSFIQERRSQRISLMFLVLVQVFLLRKLLPQTADYDFNVHVMDFNPGEYLYVKEVHYNQHGLLLVAGQGIYRLSDKWYPVQAGDAIW